MKTTKEVVKIIIDTFNKNIMYLTEENIMEVVFDNNGNYDDLEVITEVLMNDYKYAKCILNREDACFENGDGHVYSPAENQDCNSYEEWVYVPTTVETGALPKLTEETLNNLTT